MFETISDISILRNLITYILFKSINVLISFYIRTVYGNTTTFGCENLSSQENYDELKSKVASTVNVMASTVAKAAGTVANATKSEDDKKDILSSK